MNNEWFESWFNSPYYHVLYAHRDENEAEYFLSRLIQELRIPLHSKVLDLCCGKGRHAIFLNKQGLQVTGTDLSENNIREASQFKNESLDFIRADMRDVLDGKQFNYVFNLFTSFGYFETDSENEKVIQSVYHMLEPGGIFVLDFLNTTKLRDDLRAEETKKVDGIVFHITRFSCEQFIGKNIRFDVDGKVHEYSEKVRAFDYLTLVKMLEQNRFEIFRTFGSYSLSPFDEKTSDRLIMIAVKK
jgi:SAM-dependent methyltransferase